jgi:hypothetical protein
MSDKSNKRSTYIQLKEELRSSVVAMIVLGRKEVYTCRVAINAGIELVIAGTELLKMHGVTKTDVLEFVERLFDRPGDIEDMVKGGKNEWLLRAAMKMINGTIVRHTSAGNEIEGPATAEHGDDVAAVTQVRKLDSTLN